MAAMAPATVATAAHRPVVHAPYPWIVALFRRSGSTNPADEAAVAVDDADRPRAQQGKGRPTPTRKEAEAARKQTLKVPNDPKAARKAARSRAAAERSAARAALMSGDEKNLPPRDAGPVKAYVREYVDSRRSAGEFFIPVAVAILLLGWFPALAQVLVFAWVAMLIGVVADSGYVFYRLRKVLPEKFPRENRSGAIPYALMRSIQIRRLRLPKPKVKAGGAPVTPRARKR